MDGHRTHVKFHNIPSVHLSLDAGVPHSFTSPLFYIYHWHIWTASVVPLVGLVSLVGIGLVQCAYWVSSHQNRGPSPKYKTYVANILQIFQYTENFSVLITSYTFTYTYRPSQQPYIQNPALVLDCPRRKFLVSLILSVPDDDAMCAFAAIRIYVHDMYIFGIRIYMCSIESPINHNPHNSLHTYKNWYQYRWVTTWFPTASNQQHSPVYFITFP